MLSTQLYDEERAKRQIEKFSFGLVRVSLLFPMTVKMNKFQYRYIYFYDELGTSEYQKACRSDCLTPGFGRTAQKTWHSGLDPFGRAWTYEEVEQVLTDAQHEMHDIIQLCIDQGVVAREGEPSEVFTAMAREAIAKATRRNTLLPYGGFLGLSRRPAPNQVRMKIERIVKSTPAGDLNFYCRLVENIIRRQILHS